MTSYPFPGGVDYLCLCGGPSDWAHCEQKAGFIRLKVGHKLKHSYDFLSKGTFSGFQLKDKIDMGRTISHGLFYIKRIMIF